MATEKDFATDLFPHRSNRVAKSGAIACGLRGKGRAVWLHLPKRQIAAEDGVAVGGESFGERDEKRSVRVASRAVGEDEGVSVWRLRSVERAADGGIESVVEEWGHGSYGECWQRIDILSVVGMLRQSSQQVFDFYREAIRESRRATEQ